MSRLRPRTGGGALALMASLVWMAGPAAAAVPTSIAYYFSSHPMISGTVVSVDDHQLVVDTDQGERVTLAVDSRTMAPDDLAPGMVMRADFVAHENCRFFAERIVPVRGGETLNRQQAYAQTRDSGELLARGEPGSGSQNRVAGTGADDRAANGASSSSAGAAGPDQAVNAMPSTVDYLFSTRPMFSGQVVSVNDHRLVVDTDQGQRVSLVMDSRTMVPSEVAPGTSFRAEFKQMRDGRYYATRIWPVENGAGGREQAYAHTRDSELALAQSTPCGCSDEPSGVAAPSAAMERHENSSGRDGAVAQAEPQRESQRTESAAQSAPQSAAHAAPQKAGGASELPHTASSQPLLLLLGTIAVGGAGAVAAARKFWSA